MEELIEHLFAEVQKALPSNRRATGVLLESKDLNFYPDQTRVEVRMVYADDVEYPRMLVPLDTGISGAWVDILDRAMPQLKVKSTDCLRRLKVDASPYMPDSMKSRVGEASMTRKPSSVLVIGQPLPREQSLPEDVMSMVDYADQLLRKYVPEGYYPLTIGSDMNGWVGTMHNPVRKVQVFEAPVLRQAVGEYVEGDYKTITIYRKPKCRPMLVADCGGGLGIRVEGRKNLPRTYSRQEKRLRNELYRLPQRGNTATNIPEQVPG